ncbi:hypothetical protein F2Q70_00033196 [Brassica cretica]|uniref:Uncharacterized protein n=1 Tax=Brassica cretica TaxID=69181 RepID=A0A8S9FKL7_BRACR|nr:hypothetical protein F2Q70_00033196 [Brassica cretica]
MSNADMDLSKNSRPRKQQQKVHMLNVPLTDQKGKKGQRKGVRTFDCWLKRHALAAIPWLTSKVFFKFVGTELKSGG